MNQVEFGIGNQNILWSSFKNKVKKVLINTAVKLNAGNIQ